MNINKCIELYTEAEELKETDKLKSLKYYLECLEYYRSNNTLTQTEILNNDNVIELFINTNKQTYYILSDIFNREEKYIKLNNKQIDKIFDLIYKGDIDTFKKDYGYNYESFNYFNNNGLTPMHYCIKCGDIIFLEELLNLGGNININNSDSNNLLEYACINEDPNFTEYLLKYYHNIKKVIYFRKFKEYKSSNINMDVSIAQIYIFSYHDKNHKIEYLNWLIDILPNKINISHKEKIDMMYFIESLDNLLKVIKTDYRNTYIDIIKEELQYPLVYNLGCPNDTMEIITYNLIPFIYYEYNYTPEWLLNLEIKFILLKFIKDDIFNYKDNLRKYLFKKYITPEIVNKVYIKLILFKWFNIIKE